MNTPSSNNVNNTSVNPTLVPDHDVHPFDDPIDLQQLAVACRVSPDHLIEHVHAQVITAHSGDNASTWRFTSTTITRARRIAHLQHVYDADSQLAALTVDLMEEVERLRRLLG